MTLQTEGRTSDEEKTFGSSPWQVSFFNKKKKKKNQS